MAVTSSKMQLLIRTYSITHYLYFKRVYERQSW